MQHGLRRIAVSLSLAVALGLAAPALAQKSGGVLRVPHFDSPASMSILEEATRATLQPMMGVFNNLVLYDQQVAQNSLSSIVPDLATKWEWSEVTKKPDYWKPGRPYLDGIDYTIMREPGPRHLAFFAGKFDADPLGVSIPTLKDFKEQAPQAVCQVNAANVPRTMLINPHKPPSENIELRRPMILSLDRKAFVDSLNED